MTPALMPRPRRTLRPEVTALEARVTLSHATPAVHHRVAPVAEVARPAPRRQADQVVNFTGTIAGSADFFSADYYRLDENRVTVEAQGQLQRIGSRHPAVRYSMRDAYNASDFETMPFFNGPSVTNFDFTLHIQHNKNLNVKGQLYAAPIDGSSLRFVFSGIIQPARGQQPAGELTFAGVYTVDHAPQPPSRIVYSAGPFQGAMAGRFDPKRV